MNFIRSILLLLFFVFFIQMPKAQKKVPLNNGSFTKEELNRESAASKKAKLLLQEMTTEEKVLQLLSFVSNGVPRLGIPNMTAYETLHGVVSNGCTSFPQSIAMGATFDPALLKEIAVIIAKEARAVGVTQSFRQC